MDFCLRTILRFSLSPFIVKCYTQTDSKDHHVQLKSGDIYATEFQGPGCFEILKADSHFVRKCVLVNNSRLLRYFTNVFLETVVKIAMLGLT